MKFVNLFSAMCALPLAIATVAYGAGGGIIGNGGGAWVCQNNDSLGTIRWAKLVDLFELREEFHLEVADFHCPDYRDIVDKVMMHRLFAVSEDLYRSVSDELAQVQSNLVPVTAHLELVDDALFRVSPEPASCLGGKISYMQLANYTTYGKILLQQNLFENPALSETDKAALMIHEAVYAFLRDRYGDKDSVRARKIVGLLFSTILPEALKKEVEKLLGDGLSTSGMEFVRVRAGSFMMGSPASEADRHINERQHLVQLTNDFEMQSTTVTQKQYFDVMGVNPSRFKSMEDCPKTFIVAQGTTLCPNNPVETLSWDEAQTFIGRLNVTKRDGYMYRLPTEAEWEFAARAGTSSTYSFGNDASQLSLYAWFDGNSGGQTHEVGQLRPNALGLYDMQGNVWQWVQDFYGAYGSSQQLDPQGASSGSFRVLRGGSRNYYARYLRSAYRNYATPGYRSAGVGFRLVRTR